MKTLISWFALWVVLILMAAGCDGNAPVVETLKYNEQARNIVIGGSINDAQRNRLWVEDLEYFKSEFPKRHKNPFSVITKKAFNQRMDTLIAKVGKLELHQICVALCEVIAAVGVAHSNIDISNEYRYPLQFYVFADGLYVINADKTLADMLFARVTKINGVGANDVMTRLTALIPHENKSWVLAMLPEYLAKPVYMYGLGIIPDQVQTVFTVEQDGIEREVAVPIFPFGQHADFCVPMNADDGAVDAGEYNYNYKYFEKNNALLFNYNVCGESPGLPFAEFNKGMFDFMADKKVNRIIVDLRRNGGGNSEVLNPFTKQLPDYLKKNPGTKVYLLVGRNTFSSGIFAIHRIMAAAPRTISVGEPTGGALEDYGDPSLFNLPNSWIPVRYSTKYFDFRKQLKRPNQVTNTFIPEVEITPTLEDYRRKNDAVLNEAMK
ncbi:MAG: hypothetical protein FWD53_00305 [Phycisphaerales bacterium]|nr:hypothetical protein [Phycisphaerales bacterium]